MLKGIMIVCKTLWSHYGIDSSPYHLFIPKKILIRKNIEGILQFVIRLKLLCNSLGKWQVSSLFVTISQQKTQTSRNQNFPQGLGNAKAICIDFMTIVIVRSKIA